MLSEFKDNMLDPLVLHHTLRPDCPYVKYINSGSGDGSARSGKGVIKESHYLYKAILCVCA